MVANLGIRFAPNLGQIQENVHVIGEGGVGLSIGPEGLSLTLSEPAVEPAGRRPGSQRRNDGRRPHRRRTLVVHFIGGNLAGPPRLEQRLPGVSHYLIGNDPSLWRRNVPNHGRVVYEGVYPGIDVAFYGRGRDLEYDFMVAPGADPGCIVMALSGAEFTLDPAGALLIRVGSAVVRQSPPLAYQEIGGARRPVESRYALRPGGRIGLVLGAYDTTQPLVIDPTLIYNVPLEGNDVVTDEGGNAYIIRTAEVAGGLKPAVSILDPSGAVSSTTYLGGTANDEGEGIARDAEGSLYVVGLTRSPDFPVTTSVGGNSTTFNWKGFVVKLDSSGSTIIYSTYLGGTSSEVASAVAVDDEGRAYITGYTASADFPVTANAFQPVRPASHIGSTNAFLTVLDPGCTAILYSTYLGGNTHVLDIPQTDDFGAGVALAGAGHVVVAGYAGSRDFPTTPGGIKTVHDWTKYDAFVAKFDVFAPSGLSSLIYSTLLGGTDHEEGWDVAADEGGNAYVVGNTSSVGLVPGGTPGADLSFGGISDAFILKVNPAGTAYVYASYFGDARDESGYGVAIDVERNVYVTGVRVTGDYDLWLFKLNPSGTSFTYNAEIAHPPFQFGRAVSTNWDGSRVQVVGTLTARYGDVGVPLKIHGDTTRWKPQRDTAQNVEIKFTSASPLKSATVTLSGPTLVAPLQATFDPMNPPNPYVVTWAGPWLTNLDDPTSFMARGDYMIAITGVKEDNSIIEMHPADPNRIVSLTEVENVVILAIPGAEGTPLTTNPSVPAAVDQFPPQDRPGGGLRLFAEAHGPGDPARHRVIVRATVAPPMSDLRGQAPVRVHFRSLDVDDPAIACEPPVCDPRRPNAADLDLDVLPQVADNRGDPMQGRVLDALTELPTDHVDVVSGETSVTALFETSLQPGDNYRIVTSTASGWAQGIRALQPDRVGSLVHADGTPLSGDEHMAHSDMLTVWRTLHLETDSMPPPPTSSSSAERNFILGTVARIGELNAALKPTALFLTPDVTSPPLALDDGSPNLSQDPSSRGRFEQGTIRLGVQSGAVEIGPLIGNGNDFVKTVAGGFDLPFAYNGAVTVTGFVRVWDATVPSFVLDTPVPQGGRATLRVAGVPYAVQAVSSSGLVVTVGRLSSLPFRLTDDDPPQQPLSVDSSLVTDCQGSAECESDPIRNVLAHAYVVVSKDLVGTAAMPPFKRNLPHDIPAAEAQLEAGRDPLTVNSPQYWAGYFQGGYQEAPFFIDLEDPTEKWGDGDPDLEFKPGIGTAVGVTPSHSSPAGASFPASLIFIESCRDFAALDDDTGDACKVDAYRSEVVAHELGHQFRLDHREGAIMATIQFCPGVQYFSDYSLCAIRTRGGVTRWCSPR